MKGFPATDNRAGDQSEFARELSLTAALTTGIALGTLRCGKTPTELCFPRSPADEQPRRKQRKR